MTNPKKRRTEITIETRRITIIRTRAKPIHFACPDCGLETLLFAPSQAALVFGTTESILTGLRNNNLIHATNADAAYCGNSLAAHFGKEIRFTEE